MHLFLFYTVSFCNIFIMCPSQVNFVVQIDRYFRHFSLPSLLNFIFDSLAFLFIVNRDEQSIVSFLIPKKAICYHLKFCLYKYYDLYNILEVYCIVQVSFSVQGSIMDINNRSRRSGSCFRPLLRPFL